MSNGIQTLRKINFSAAVTLIVASIMFGTSAGADTFMVTNPPSTRKVLPDIAVARPGAGDAGPQADILRIAMARGEYEPVQIVVHAADKPLRRVRVSVSNLVGPKGSVLPQEQITVTPLGYVNCTKSSFRGRLITDKGGQVPDMIEVVMGEQYRLQPSLGREWQAGGDRTRIYSENLIDEKGDQLCVGGLTVVGAKNPNFHFISSA